MREFWRCDECSHLIDYQPEEVKVISLAEYIKRSRTLDLCRACISRATTPTPGLRPGQKVIQPNGEIPNGHDAYENLMAFVVPEKKEKDDGASEASRTSPTG